MIRVRLLALTMILLAVGLAGAQDWTEMSPEEQQAMMEAWMKLGSPAEAHQHLDDMVGSWKTTTSVWMSGPGSEAMVTEGTSEKSWVLGGRWVEERYQGAMMGRPLEGRGMTGFDNYKNMYINTWQDDGSTTLTYALGVRNPDTGVLTFYGQADEPMLEVQDRTIKYTYVIESRDRHVFNMYDLHAGDDYKIFEIVYERLK